ncbi:MAG: CHAD domain-containing protein [Dehalococcoidales bacterium]
MNDVSKTIEIELKFIIPGAQAEVAVVNCLRQNKYAVDKISALKNTDIYMDTTDWMLLKNKLSLRYRLSNNTAMYTMKSVNAIEGGIAKRVETEIILKKPAHPPTDIPIKTLRKQVNDVIYPRKLMEQILIRTNRRRYLVTSPERAKFELDFDTSSFSADALFKPSRTSQLHQLEAEIIEGSEMALGSMAQLISDNFSYPKATKTKLEIAMAHLKIEALIKKIPENLKVKLDDRLDAALKKILAVEFRWLEEQLSGAISDRDPEFVHQARVATRRMRSALILFHNAIPETTAIYFEERLKWLGGLFGEVRDLDVFIINLTGYKQMIESFSKEKRKTLENLVVKQRRIPLKALSEALKSRRFKNFENRMTKFLAEPCVDCQELPLAMKPIREVAPQVITQKFESVIEQSKKTLANPKLVEFHALRIQMKRLRYTFEFLAPPYGGAFDDVIHRTVEIQNCLGELQDTVFNQKLITHILEDWQGKLVDADLIFVLGEIYQFQGEIARERQKNFKQLWDCFCLEQTHVLLDDVFREQVKAN